MNFAEKLAALLNEFNWDVKTDTPDHVLAEEVEAFLEGKIIPESPNPDPGPGIEIPVDGPPPPPNGG